MDKAVLLHELNDAFASVPKPDISDIAPHDCPECDDLRRDLAPFDWRMIPDPVLDKHAWDLPLLSDEGKQYYLPAWIRRSIEAVESDYTPAVVYSLEDPSHRWFPVTPYTERQFRVFRHYLDYLAEFVDEISREHVKNARSHLNREP